jgi:hypothetical protein
LMNSMFVSSGKEGVKFCSLCCRRYSNKMSSFNEVTDLLNSK